MLDLKSLSITASVKIDSPDRLRNVKLFLQYFRTFFCNYELVIVEQGEEQSALDELLKDMPVVKHRFLRSSNCHYKTRNLNLATSLSTGRYVMMCDVDVFVPPAAILESIDKLDAGAHFVYPYNGVMVQIKRHCIEENLEFNDLLRRVIFFDKFFDIRPNKYDLTDCEPIYGGSRYDSLGGAVLFRREPFFCAGGWNENIISYGFEDMELNERFRKLDGQIARLDNFNCYHFEHRRGADSYYNNFYRSNEQEYLAISAMGPDELRSYVDCGFKRLQMHSRSDFQLVNTQSEYFMRLVRPDRKDLSNLAIILAIRHQAKGPVFGISGFLQYLEDTFNDYQVVIVEVGSRKFKYLDNKKNSQYIWLESTHTLKSAVDRGVQHTEREFVDVYEFDDDVDTIAILRKYQFLAEGGDNNVGFTRRLDGQAVPAGA